MSPPEFDYNLTITPLEFAGVLLVIDSDRA